MKKPYYADYVNHILRFYFRYDCHKGFKNQVDKMNYQAADKVITKLSNKDKEILETIYTMDDINIVNCIRYLCDNDDIEMKKIWVMLSTVTTNIAKERKLL